MVDEILEFDGRGELSEYITYYEAQRMPYFQACMREALRMHPAVGQLLERIVPKEGANIDGVFLPEGTIVGINPWVASRDKKVYGSDAEEFRPERWIEADEKELKLMDRNWLAVSFAEVCPIFRLFSLTSLLTVWRRRKVVSRKEHIADGDVEVGAATSSQVSCRAGGSRERMGTL